MVNNTGVHLRMAPIVDQQDHPTIQLVTSNVVTVVPANTDGLRARHLDFGFVAE